LVEHPELVAERRMRSALVSRENSRQARTVVAAGEVDPFAWAKLRNLSQYAEFAASASGVDDAE
jgi:hypothetical protein